MSQYAVIGQAPTHDTSVGTGPFRSYDAAFKASEELDHRGWNTEIVELLPLAEIGFTDWSDET